MNDIFSILYNQGLKTVKKNVGKGCTFIGNRITVDGARVIDVYIKTNGVKKELQFKFPHDLSVVTKHDYERLEELIKEQLCQ